MFVHVCTFAKLRHYLLDKLAKSFSLFSGLWRCLSSGPQRTEWTRWRSHPRYSGLDKKSLTCLKTMIESSGATKGLWWWSSYNWLHYALMLNMTSAFVVQLQIFHQRRLRTFLHCHRSVIAANRLISVTSWWCRRRQCRWFINGKTQK